MLKKLFLDHPNSVDETYFEHFVHACSFSVTMLLGGCACFVHALVPGLCKRTGSNAIQQLHDRMIVNRKRKSAEVDGIEKRAV